jgi:hypothetical protein
MTAFDPRRVGPGRDVDGRRERSRPVVGVLTQDLLELFAEEWLGAVDGARANGSDLICFTGRALDAPGYLRSANAIYDLVGPESVDGLVVWSAEPDGTGGTLVVEVAADGVGFDPAVSFPGHLGLATMRERAQRLGGRFTVDSSPTGSTTIRVVLPGILRRVQG